jgi:siroheme synthase-like protein
MAERLLPVMLRVQGKCCVVIGGGEVAAQKVRQLLECGAEVVIVSPDLCDELMALARSGQVRWLPQPYEASVLDGAFLVFACTDDNAVNRQVFADCEARRLWCNVVDVPDLCSFFMPSILRRGELIVAVSTSGNSPAFARQVRLFLESVLGDEFGTLTALLGELKGEVRQKLPTIEARRQFVQRVWESEIWQHLRDGNLPAARESLRACLAMTAAQGGKDEAEANEGDGV